MILTGSHDLFCTHSTCFYALCLIAKTTKGVQQLKRLGWVSVCHSHEHKWPVLTNKNTKAIPPSKDRYIIQQKSLPEVVLSTESPDITAAQKRLMLKKSTSTMAGCIPEKITEGIVFDDIPDVMATSQLEYPRLRSNNVSPQQRPVSMISLGNVEGYVIV